MPRLTRNVLIVATGLTLLAQMALSQAIAADVYKYTDAQGKVHYTDKPRTLPAERIGLQSRRTDTVAVQERDDAERARQQEADAQRRANAAKQSDQRQASITDAKSKAEICNQARERYAKNMSTQRIYETLPNGERRYLNDAELDKARATAKTAMEELCK